MVLTYKKSPAKKKRVTLSDLKGVMASLKNGQDKVHRNGAKSNTEKARRVLFSTHATRHTSTTRHTPNNPQQMQEDIGENTIHERTDAYKTPVDAGPSHINPSQEGEGSRTGHDVSFQVEVQPTSQAGYEGGQTTACELEAEAVGDTQPVSKPKTTHRGKNKVNHPTERVFIDVNDQGQPDNEAQRKMSSFIGFYARDPRKLPINVTHWSRMEEWRISHIWDIVKESYYFPEGREPYDWVKAKINNCWRDHKSELRRNHIEGKTKEQALRNKPLGTPDLQWKQFVEFCMSSEGQARRERGIANQAESKTRHYAGTKTFARLRKEKRLRDGKEPDELEIFEETHIPKAGTKLDDGSAAALAEIHRRKEELSKDADEEFTREARKKIFTDVVGEDKNGYAKTYGLGVKVSRATMKRSALAEEQAKNKMLEEELKKTNESLKTAWGEINSLKSILFQFVEKEAGVMENAEEEVQNDAENEEDHAEDCEDCDEGADEEE